MSEHVNAIRVDSPNELVIAVPFLMGYLPDNELVAIGCHNGTIAATARITANEVRRFGYDCTAWRLASNGTTTVNLIAFGSADALDAAVHTARTACTAQGMNVAAALRVHDGCWRSYLAPDRPATCIHTDPDLINRLTDEYGSPATHPEVDEVGLEPITGSQAETFRAAISKAETRLAAESQHDSVAETMHKARSLLETLNDDIGDSHEIESIRQALAMAEAKRKPQRKPESDAQTMYNALRLVEKLTDTGHYPDVHQAAAISVYLSMDDIGSEMEKMSVEIINDDGQTSMMLWTWLTARMPVATRWRAAALAAYAAWVCGNTTLAAEAAELSVSLHPEGNRIAAAVQRALNDGISIDDDNATDYVIGDED